MVIKKKVIALIIILIALCIPNISKAADYIVALDAGHSLGLKDVDWWENLSGEKWDYDKWGSREDKGNIQNGMISFTEALATKKVVTYMNEYLKQYDNIDVVICPRTASNKTVERVNYAINKKANIHLSVHFNSSGYTTTSFNSFTKGVSVYYSGAIDKDVSKKFADTVLKAVMEKTELNKYGAGVFNKASNSIRMGSFSQTNNVPNAVIKSAFPSVQLEAGFCDNTADLIYISEEANLKKIAQGAVSAILQQLGVADKGYPEIEDYVDSAEAADNDKISGIYTSNEKKFLGLWKNATGTYEQYYNNDGSINELALYRENGNIVKYGNRTSPASDIIGTGDWFFELLEKSQRTQNHLIIMKYLMNIYTNTKEYGDIDFERDIVSLFNTSNFSNVSSIYGGTIQEKVWFALRDAGYSEEATAGVMGNIEQESNFNPTAQNSIGASGICQWLNTRKTGLDAYAASKGVDWQDEDTQVEYLIGELTLGGGAGGHATYQIMTNKGYNRSSWEDASNPADAATAFCWIFERPGDSEANIPNRIKAANKYYNEFKGKVRSNGGSYLDGSDDSRVNGYYTSGKGKKHTILNQTKINGWGSKCNRAASAIIASGYSNESADQLINNINSKYDGAYFGAIPGNSYWNSYGLQVTSTVGNTTRDYMTTLKNQLTSGGYALFWLNCGGTYYGKSGIKWTSQYHWIAILDYKNENGTDKICVGDWHGINWVDIDEFSGNGVAEIVYVNER